MRTFRPRAVAILGAFLVWAAAASTSNAQYFFGADNSDRQLLPGAIIPHDGQPFSHRYGFFVGSASYFAPNYNQLEYLDYLDRLDRAERFGYRLPAPPAFLNAPRCRPCGPEALPPPLLLPIR